MHQTVPCTLALVLLTTSVYAYGEPGPNARKIIQAYYKASDAAYERGDWKAASARHRKDYESTGASGIRRDQEELNTVLPPLLKRSSNVRYQSHLYDFEQEGSRATVHVREHLQLDIKEWLPGKPKRTVIDDTVQDEWARGPGGWFQIRSTELTSNVKTSDGKAHKERAGYVRVVKQHQKAREMDTAIGTFVNKAGQVVDLVGAVHLGEKSYYRQLNGAFKNYDAVLYELVAPHSSLSEQEEARYRQAGKRLPRLIPKPGDEADNPLSAAQLKLTRMLGLTFQLNEVDYSPANFVQADLSPEELYRSMSAKGESASSIMLKLIQKSLGNAAAIDPADALTLDYTMATILMRGPSRHEQAALRRVLASSFQKLETTMEAFNGPDGSSLITVRNQRALAVMQDELKRGRKHLAIFYGAGHMADMEARLVKGGFTQRRLRYLKAWDLAEPAATGG